MDGPITGSKSRFLPRIQNDKLQLQLDAFKFHQEMRPEVHIVYSHENMFSGSKHYEMVMEGLLFLLGLIILDGKTKSGVVVHIEF